MINLSGKNAASRGYFEVIHSTVGFRPAAPVSVTSTVLNAGIIGCNLPGRSRFRSGGDLTLRDFLSW